ncbi:hypothetical protein OG876_01825 [Kribbella sp. NBC_00359]
MAQFGARRMTRDIDILGQSFTGEETGIIRRIRAIARPKSTTASRSMAQA